MNTRDPSSGQASPEVPLSLEAATGEAIFLLARAVRQTIVFRRLFWVAAVGLGLTGVAVVCGDWEAHPGRWLGLAGVGQAWLVSAALWALRVYRHIERLEQTARAVSTPA